METLTLSWVYLRKNEYKLALEFIEKLPEDDDYWKMLRGYVYVKTGQPDKAMKYWNEMEIESERTMGKFVLHGHYGCIPGIHRQSL